MEDETTPDPGEAWLQHYGGRFLLFARQQTRCEADAEDVLQEALVEVWERTGSSIPDPARVFATIRRRAIDLGRSLDRRRAREQRERPIVDWFEPDPAETDTREFLERALGLLPDEQAEVVLLKIWGELTFREIAETLGIPANTAASRYRYALEQLRGELKEAF